MGGVFSSGGGGKKKNATSQHITSQDWAVLKLKEARDAVMKEEKRIKKIIGLEEEAAKKRLQAGDREGAKRALRIKKMQKKQLGQLSEQLATLRQMVDTIEYKSIEAKVMEGLEQGNSALEAIHNEWSVDRVQNLMADTEDAIDRQREIDELLGQHLDTADDEAVAKELEELMADDLAKDLNTIGPTPDGKVDTGDRVEVPISAAQDTAQPARVAEPQLVAA